MHVAVPERLEDKGFQVLVACLNNDMFRQGKLVSENVTSLDYSKV